MKKILALLLTLMLLLSAASALAAPNDALLFQRDTEDPNAPSVYIQQLAAVGSDVYFVAQTYDGETSVVNLYHYTIGQTGEPEIAVGNTLNARDYSSPEDVDESMDVSQGIGYLAGDGESLYNFNTLTGEISRMTVADGKLSFERLATLDMQTFMITQDDYSYLMDMRTPVVTGGHMYFVTNDWSGSDPVYTLVNVDLADGKTVSVKLNRNVGELAAYKPTDAGTPTLLAYVYADWDEQTQLPIPAQLAVMDGVTGEMATLVTLENYENLNGITYDAATDTLYYVSEDTVWARTAMGDPQRRAYLSLNYIGSAVLAGGCYVSAAGNYGLQVSNLDPSYLPTTVLRIANSYRDQAAMDFTKKYPDIPLLFLDNYYSNISELGQAMLTGDDSVDLIAYWVNNGFDTLLAKGYCADLSSSQKLMDYVAKMYPQMQKEVMKDGKLYALPVDVSTWPMNVYQSSLDTVGLTMDELPTNYIDLCAAITKWNDEWPDNDETANMLPFSSGKQREAVFDLMLQSYMDYYDAMGMDLDFDTPLFHSMLEALDNMRSDNFDMSDNPTDQERDEYYQLKTSLFNREMSVMNSSTGEYAMHSYCPSLAADMDYTVSGQMQVMFVNPRCANVDKAIQLLENYVDSADNQTQLMLSETMGGPVLNKYFDQNVADWQKQLEEYKTMLTTADESDKSWIQESIEYMEQLLERQEDYRYDLSPETVEEYRATIGSHLYPRHQNVLNISDDDTASQISTLHERYKQKQLTADQYIKELNAKVRMIVLENQ